MTVSLCNDIKLLTRDTLLSLGVAVGAGMQGIVAVINLVCYYIIGIPSGALLGYLTNLQVKVYDQSQHNVKFYAFYFG